MKDPMACEQVVQVKVHERPVLKWYTADSQ